MFPLEKEPSTAVLGLIGDVMIGRLVDDCLAYKSPAYIWGDLLPTLKQTDLNLINLETTLTTSSEAVYKVFNFKANPDRVRSLVEGKIDVVNLANNHILDFAQQGLRDTIQTLDAAGIRHVGAGVNAAEAQKAVVIEKNDIRIGIIGCTDNEREWEATKTSGGTCVLDVLKIDQLIKQIRKIRSKVDVLILSIHWGPNMKQRPSTPFIEFAHRAIEAGVTILHGHSAHIFQGMEVYKGGLILYDTGDFVDDYAVDESLRNDRSFLFLVKVDRVGVKTVTLIPTLIQQCQNNRVTGTDLEETMDRMVLLSKQFHCVLEKRKEPLPHLLLQVNSRTR
jgi:poly-gamma-glutamate capsule biosynthesis protein CapA/YwtB (metallophosphatase superfamily)